ncbi:phosphoribosyl-ATP pyrophosphatase [Skermanella stibiiresistens SB22]|uniref:Phosphoribosyl-ATP pyrophosphatase n=1 Tax=Skermanella stibiiresistens SB22 TaxID=1385369 RepID=W9H132_9PROT|nr:phosphoribosyl-ATP diphosphatase [Skermanella stibiiresistens]EWY39764.1 phosphoribosyl-ATP pyrophosphatase [Skermanella stibiiresistens SB22]
MNDLLRRLYDSILERRNLDPKKSRTAKLHQAGRDKMAQKVGEEAVEIVIEAIQDNHDGVVAESADLIYNLTVLWADMGITPEEIWEELRRREAAFGIAEKLPKSGERLPVLDEAFPVRKAV